LIESPYSFFEGKLFDKYPQPGECVDKKLDMELYCRMPLALYSDVNGTLGKNPAYPFQPLDDVLDAINGPFSGNDEAVRLAGVTIAWNIFQHFYPYFDVVEVDWDQQLTIALQSALRDKDEKAFVYTLKRLLVALQDGHASLYHHSLRGSKLLPLMLGWIENRVVVTASKEERVKKGDIILGIDGTPAEQVLRERMKYISGSPQWRRFLGLYYTLYGPADKKARLRIQRAGEILEIEVERNHLGGWRSIPEFDHSPIEKLENDIFYVDLNYAGMEEIDKKIKEIADARGVIFDLRGYPKGNYKIISYLLKEKDTAEWMFVPRIIYPDQENLVGYRAWGWEVEPLEPHIKGKVVFLTDGRAISAAESFMSFIEHYQLGEIVGQPTAGTNGNINPFELSGGYYFWWSGMRVLKKDGRQLHLVGIQPTVPVERTIKDVTEGSDTLFEKALEIIRSHKPGK
jgi:C-terminal processing protease CtpA/Prc